MNQSTLVGEVMNRMGQAAPQEADRAIGATLQTLGERLSKVDAQVVSEEVPAPFDEVLREAERDGDMDLRGFYQRVAQREGVSLGYAMEHAQAVCSALANHLSEQARAQLTIRLWPELVRPALEDRMAPTAPRHAQRLADGFPDSRKRISEARPPSRAQSGSVARDDNAGGQSGSVLRADNPHGDEKISSAGTS